MQRPSVRGGRRVEKNGQASFVHPSIENQDDCLAWQSSSARKCWRTSVPPLTARADASSYNRCHAPNFSDTAARFGSPDVRTSWRLSDRPCPIHSENVPGWIDSSHEIIWPRGPSHFSSVEARSNSLLQSVVITVTLCAVGAGHTFGGRRQ